MGPDVSLGAGAKYTEGLGFEVTYANAKYRAKGVVPYVGIGGTAWP